MSSQLAANHWNQQQAEQEERMRMKKLTLDINERQEQEDYQGKQSFIGQKWKIYILFGFLNIEYQSFYPPLLFMSSL